MSIKKIMMSVKKIMMSIKKMNTNYIQNIAFKFYLGGDDNFWKAMKNDE